MKVFPQKLQCGYNYKRLAQQIFPHLQYVAFWLVHHELVKGYGLFAIQSDVANSSIYHDDFPHLYV